MLSLPDCPLTRFFLPPEIPLDLIPDCPLASFFRSVALNDNDLPGPEIFRKYQKWTVDKIIELSSIILAFDMGSGKTISTLTAVRKLLDRGDIKRVLVVAPLLVAETVWPDEIEGWRHTQSLTYEVITGTEKRRIARASRNVEIHIINKENLVWLWKHFGEGKHWPYDMVIIDEASMLKNGKKRTKNKTLTRFGVLAKARKYIKRVVELTGTPSPKGLQNLWGLAYIADGGERLGTSRTAFEQRWFHKDEYSYKIEPKSFAKKQITRLLKDIMFSLDPSDLDELPPIVPVPHYVNLSQKVLKEYKRFERTLVSETYDVEAVSRGVLTQKLLQFANGSMYREDKSPVPIHDLKLKALEEIHEAANGTPLFVAYSFKFDLDRILKKFPHAVVLKDEDARETMRRWNRGEIDILLAHAASAAHGLNLQYGSNIAVWYGLPHDLELYQQFNKRLHRPGQTRTVFLHLILARGTIDDDLPDILAARAANQNDVLDAVKARIRKVG